MRELDCGLEFDPLRDEDFFSALPARPAVYVLEPRTDPPRADVPRPHPYLRGTANLRRSCERLLAARSEPSKRLHLREIAARLRYRLTGSPFEQALLLYQQAQQLFPRRFRELLRMRPPALLKINRVSEYPRCYVTRRILSDGGFYFGPFPTRKAADAFAQEFLNLFKIRRCQIKIRRDPSFPGCIYSEMKMCLAPCFAGCSKPEYDVELSRVVNFLSSRGDSLAAELDRERDAASDTLDFERAAVAHKRHDKVAGVLRGLPELVRRVEELDAVVLQRAAQEDVIAVFAISGGRIADPFRLQFGELASQPRSVELILREHFSAVCGAANSAWGPDSPTDDRADHLSLLARWFYSKPRQGEIFFRGRGVRGLNSTASDDWPYRRIIRGCGRLLAPPAAPPRD